MTQELVKPLRQRGEPELPPWGILAVNPSDVAQMAALARAHGLKEYFLFHSRLYSSADFFLAGPAVGAPMAVICLEKLIALGASSVVLYGWCGSLSPQLHAMDILLPTWSLSEEGTSKHYLLEAQPRADSGLHDALRCCFTGPDFPSPPKEGPIWTTDAPYRETSDKVERYSSQGIVAVDMEYSALCAAARFRGVALGAVMLVSDELWRIPWQPLYRHKEFKRRSGQILSSLCQQVKNLAQPAG